MERRWRRAPARGRLLAAGLHQGQDATGLEAAMESERCAGGNRKLVQNLSFAPGSSLVNRAPDSIVSERTRSSADAAALSLPLCRFCQAPLRQTFVDLGMSPLSNAYLSAAQLNRMEPFYPLCARVCLQCFLVQLDAVAGPEELFGDYAYFSSYSASWLKHAQAYASAMIERFQFDARSLVVEVASNDGYLLQYFRERGIPVLGIEPARNVARAAEGKGIPTLAKFFGRALAGELAASGRQAQLIVGNN